MRASFSIAAFAALSLASAFASPALAETMKFTAKLDGSQQVPPVQTSATGTADISYDTDSKSLQWTIDYSGLSGPAVAAHFHGPASPGEKAGVEIPLSGDLTSPVKGNATLTDAQAKDLTDGKLYLNIHTSEHKDGEIRGQVTKSAM